MTMTIEEIAQLLTAGATMFAAIASAVVSWRNGRKLVQVERKQDIQHDATNSRLDQLVSSTGREQRAEGLAEGLVTGRAAGRAEQQTKGRP